MREWQSSVSAVCADALQHDCVTPVSSVIDLKEQTKTVDLFVFLNNNAGIKLNLSRFQWLTEAIVIKENS